VISEYDFNLHTMYETIGDWIEFFLFMSACLFFPLKFADYYYIILWNQTSASSQHTRPGTADKGIQCEILTSDGIMVPWEELITPYNGNDTEHTVLPEPESLKASQGYGNKLDTSEHLSVQQVCAHNG